MADKQIIIDGVDVSGCENYGETMAKTHNCTLYDEYLRPCKGANCYYKQLKRKEQECERLKEYLNQIRDEELSHLDIEWDEYETSARQEDYSNIITLVERALGEIDD